MTTYFDVTSESDLKLLPKEFRRHEQLEEIATLAEADVIGMFTDAPPYYNYTGRATLLEDGITPLETAGEDVSNTGAPSSALVPQLRVYLRG